MTPCIFRVSLDAARLSPSVFLLPHNAPVFVLLGIKRVKEKEKGGKRDTYKKEREREREALNEGFSISERSKQQR